MFGGNWINLNIIELEIYIGNKSIEIYWYATKQQNIFKATVLLEIMKMTSKVFRLNDKKHPQESGKHKTAAIRGPWER